ncbi:hypothetical protein OG920_19550 [Streptomyces europaeiscabiei]|uniref:hypothetical protein n=1 Tax=Streptomyces europaeiscabiei TaxID=146819 RepID=UPI0030E1D2E5
MTLNSETFGRIRDYHPRLPHRQWARRTPCTGRAARTAVADQVRATVATTTPATCYEVRRLLYAVGRLAVWVDSDGLPPDPGLWLRTETIDAFVPSGSARAWGARLCRPAGPGFAAFGKRSYPPEAPPTARECIAASRGLYRGFDRITTVLNPARCDRRSRLPPAHRRRLRGRLERPLGSASRRTASATGQPTGPGPGAVHAPRAARGHEPEKRGMYEIHEHDLPTPSSEPRGIALGPDGSMWTALEIGSGGPHPKRRGSRLTVCPPRPTRAEGHF